MLFRCSQHDSAVTCNFFSLLLPLFPFLSSFFFFEGEGLRFFSFSVSFDSEMNWKVERRREREACETNEQQPLRGSCYPRSIGVYSPGVLPPNPVYLPEIYIYMLYFRRCFAFVFHRTMKETLRTICSLYFPSLPTEEERIFIYVRRYGELHELFATETRRGRGIIKI